MKLTHEKSVGHFLEIISRRQPLFPPSFSHVACAAFTTEELSKSDSFDALVGLRASRIAILSEYVEAPLKSDSELERDVM